MTFVWEEEGTTVCSVRNNTLRIVDGRDLGDIRITVSTAPGNRTKGVNASMDTSVLLFLEPRLLAVRDLPQPLVEHEVLNKHGAGYVWEG